MKIEKNTAGIIDSIRYKLITGSVWATIGQFSTLLFGFLASMMLTRLLPAQDVGVYLLMISFVGIVTSIFSLGLPVTIVRKISQYMALDEIGLVKQIIVVCLMITTILGFFAYSFTLIFGSWLAEHVFGTTMLAILMPQIGFLVFVALMRGFIAESFRGFHDLRLATVFGGMTTSFLTAIALSVLWWLQGSSNIKQVVWISMISAGLVGFVALIYFFKKLKSLACSTATPLKQVLKDIFSISWGMWLIGLLMLLLSNADLWIVSALGTSDNVAIYGVAARLTMLVTVFHSISVAMIQPIISELHAKNDMKKLEQVVRTVTTLSFIPAFLITLVFIFFGKGLLENVYGDFYGQASWILVVLSAMHIIGMIVGPIGIIQMMTGLQLYFFFLSAITGLLSVILAVIFMPNYGVIGVAYAWLIASFVHSILNAWVIWRKLQIKCYFSPMVLYKLFTKPGLISEVLSMRRSV